jgi:BirA family biotin operon repressor/biotin-[acetyl-CoA-carboxylase] ligase
MATPLSTEHLDRVGSTQDEARLRYAGAPLLVTASGQDAGRGRSGAGWIDADRALAATLAFEPGWSPDRLPVLTLVAGLAALDVLPSHVSLKWPNDVVVGDAKAGGILTEASDGIVLVGFGLNVAWAEPPDGMTGLHRTDPGPDHARAIAERWAAALLERCLRGPDGWGRDEYADRCSTIGRSVVWDPDGAGLVTGIGERGELLVETAAGPAMLDSGVVRVVRPA